MVRWRDGGWPDRLLCCFYVFKFRRKCFYFIQNFLACFFFIEYYVHICRIQRQFYKAFVFIMGSDSNIHEVEVHAIVKLKRGEEF